MTKSNETLLRRYTKPEFEVAERSCRTFLCVSPGINDVTEKGSYDDFGSWEDE